MPIFTRYKLSGEFKPDDELKQLLEILIKNIKNKIDKFLLVTTILS